MNFIIGVLIVLLIALGWILRMVYGWWRRESAERQSARVIAEAQLEA
jgi:hypothetical protein